MESSLNRIAVIIARAGSHGLPNKSMKQLDGQPLVAWTIEHAVGSQKLDAVVLTTDGPDIAAVGHSYGIHIYERPAALATDDATVDAAARHGTRCWEQEQGEPCDHVAILYANVALRPVDLTDRAMSKLQETGADSVQSVFPVGKMHPLWMRTVSDNQEGQTDVLGMYEPNRIYRRQDLPPVYMLDAGACAVRRQSLFHVDPAEPHAFLGKDRRAIVNQPGDVVDIDTEMDFFAAEAMLAWKRRQGTVPALVSPPPATRIRAAS